MKYCIKKIITSICVLTLIFLGIQSYAIDDVKQNVDLSEQHSQNLVTKISFDEVLKKAKDHAYDLQIADYEVLISKQEIRGARSEYFPKLNFMAGTEYTRNFRDIKDTTVMSIGDAFINPYTRYQSILGITVGYNLFDFGVRGNNLKIAKEDVKLKDLELKQKLQEMNLTLLDSYTKATPILTTYSKSVWCLGDSIKIMSWADMVIFAKDYSEARGCCVEFDICRAYPEINYTFEDFLKGGLI